MHSIDASLATATQTPVILTQIYPDDEVVADTRNLLACQTLRDLLHGSLHVKE